MNLLSRVETDMNPSTPVLDSSPAFLRRFDAFALDYRRRRMLRCICWTMTAALAAFTTIAALDYLFELAYPLRAAAAALLIAAVALGTLAGAVQTMRRATDQNVAAEMENRFPELGQAVRTAVQYRGVASASGASPALVAAMQNDLEARTSVLPLDQALARGRTRRSVLALAAVAAVLLAAVAVSWQWRLAAQRSLFGNEPFTRLAVSPGEAEVNEGSSLQIAATIEGRMRPAVLMTRPATGASAPWLERELSPADEVRRDSRLVQYEVDLSNLEQPVEYRLVAGPYSSATHRVRVRRLLDIQSTQIAVEPPAYTGAAPTSFDEGSFRGLVGSHVRVRFTLDRPAREAALVLTPLGRTEDGEVGAAPQTIALAIDGRTLTGEFDLAQDATYAVTGRGVDGARLRDNRARIRVVHDQLPRIVFRDPAIVTEVHSLAEIAMRAHVDDDFGLAKAGIVFRINNGQEYSLVSFPKVATDKENASEVPARSDLEATLPLEELDITQRDSISYFAYAEDNAPGGVRRVETELRFIDIRPFRRIYRMLPGGGVGGGGAGGPQLASLEQLIRRERWLLNRSSRLARAVERGERTNLDEVDDAISMQDDTAGLTRELADAALEAEAILEITEDRVSDLFYAAEEAMMRAIDALSVGEFQRSHLQQVDAAASLVAARNAIEFLISQGGGAGAFERLLRLDADMSRRMQNLSESERLAEVARRLRALAKREERVAGELSQLGQMADADDTTAQTDQHRELDSEQSDLVMEAEEINAIVQELETVTELIRTRSRAGIEAGATVSTALDQMAISDAADAARRAGWQFRELAQHVEGVLPTEPAGRLAVARDVASQVALELRNLGAELARMAASPNDAMSAPQQTANDLDESWLTVSDILDSIIAAFETQQDDVVPRLRQLLDENDVARVAALFEQIEATIAANRWGDAELEVEGAADQMDQVSQRLDALHASLVAPRLAQLQALQQRAAELQSQMSQLASDVQVDRWRQRLNGLVTDLESSGVRLVAAPDVRELAASSSAAGESWRPAGNGMLQPPAWHIAAIDALVQELQRYLHELAFGRVDAEGADLAPPQYVDLVRRYMELLSEDAGR
jgi:hypothetical protein